MRRPCRLRRAASDVYAPRSAGNVHLPQVAPPQPLVPVQTRAVSSYARASTDRASGHTRQYKSLGELVNLMSVDVQRLTDLVPYLHNLLWSSPLQILLAMYLLFRLVGVASLVGFGVMIAVIP
eukprot:1561280-Rhodomonas_salina.4